MASYTTINSACTLASSSIFGGYTKKSIRQDTLFTLRHTGIDEDGLHIFFPVWEGTEKKSIEFSVRAGDSVYFNSDFDPASTLAILTEAEKSKVADSHQKVEEESIIAQNELIKMAKPALRQKIEQDKKRRRMALEEERQKRGIFSLPKLDELGKEPRPRQDPELFIEEEEHQPKRFLEDFGGLSFYNDS